MTDGDILVVEDEPGSLRLVTEILTAKGFAVRQAADGELALAAVAAKIPELILLDIRLPGMDGFEVLRRLKSRPETREISVIILSAISETSVRVKGLDLGAVDFISKPFQRDELLAKVRTQMELYSLRGELKKQALTLKENNAKLELALQSSHMGVWQFFVAENKRVFDDQVCRLLGLDPAVFGGTEGEFFAALHPDDRKKVEAALERTIRGGAPYSPEYRAVWPDGSVHFLASRGKLISDAKGSLLITGILWDVTERKLSDESLRESEAKFRILYESSQDAIMTLFPPDWRFASGNPAMIKLFGAKDEADFTSKDPWELSPEYQPDGEPSSVKAKRMIETAMDKGGSFFEWTHKKIGGPAFQATVLLTRFEHAGKAGLQATVRDITERKLAEEKLLESEKKYRSLFEVMLDGFALHDMVFDKEGKPADYIFLSMNPAFERLTGLSAAATVGRRVSEIMPAEAREWVEIYGKVAVTGEPARFERYCQALDRHFSIMAFRPREGQFACVFKDISEQKKAEGALRESEARYRELVENLNDLVFMLDTKGAITYLGPQVLALAGYRPEELLGRPFAEVVYPEDLPVMLRRFREVVMENRLEPQEFRFYTKDGAVRWARSSSRPILENGKPTGLRGVISDVTEAKKAEAGLRESYEMQTMLNAMLQRSLENVPLPDKLSKHLSGLLAAPWLSVEARGAVFLTTPRTRELVMAAHQGLSPELVTKCAKVPFGTCLCGQAAATGLPAVSCCIGPEHQITYEGIHAHGHYCAPIIAEGKVLGVLNLYLKEGAALSERQERFVKAAVDVMAENILHSQVEEKFSQAQKMEAVGLLAGGVAHDFNNILTAIKCYTEFIRKALAPGDPKLEDVQEISSSVERAISLTRQLLAFSRRQILAPKVVDINKTLGEMTNMLRRIIGEHITLNTKLFPSPCLVKADPGQLEQVIMNLAVNARDAMPDGGTITLETEILRPDEEFFYARPELPIGQLVRLMVRDTGTGMTPEVKDRLFEPFFTTKEQGKGTGLGLSMVFGIVKQSNGEIEVESEPGKGSAFIVYLPFAEKTPKFKDSKAKGGDMDIGGKEEEPPAERHETVLLVEDEDSLRRLGERVLRGNGYTVLAAADGQEALELMEERGKPVDLLVTDVVMPGMSGRDLARTLARKKLIGRTLYMSGYTDDAIVKHGVLEPGIAFIYKPFTVDALVLKLREVLDGPADKAKA